MQKPLKGPRTDWRRISWRVGVIVVLTLALWFASRIPRTMTIFAIAAFIAFGVQPLVLQLERRRVHRALAVAIVFVALLLVIVVGLVLIVPMTIEQTQALGANAPSYIATAQSWINDGQEWLRVKLHGANVPASAFDLSRLSGARLAAVATTTLSSAYAVLLTTATAFFVSFSALVLSFFFLVNDRQIFDGFVSLFPERRRPIARAMAAEITALFGSYISGQVIVCAITGVVIAIASALLGFKFPLILGIIAGIAYAIPIFGMLIAQLIALLLCAPQGIWMVIWVQVVMFAMARVSDNVLVPKIMGNSVGVSPIGVMFAVFAGGELFGLPGLLLGIPAAALIKILWRYFFGPWLQRQLDADPESEPSGDGYTEQTAQLQQAGRRSAE